MPTVYHTRFLENLWEYWYIWHWSLLNLVNNEQKSKVLHVNNIMNMDLPSGGAAKICVISWFFKRLIYESGVNLGRVSILEPLYNDINIPTVNP